MGCEKTSVQVPNFRSYVSNGKLVGWSLLARCPINVQVLIEISLRAVLSSDHVRAVVVTSPHVCT